VVIADPSSPDGVGVVGPAAAGLPLNLIGAQGPSLRAEILHDKPDWEGRFEIVLVEEPTVTSTLESRPRLPLNAIDKPALFGAFHITPISECAPVVRQLTQPSSGFLADPSGMSHRA